MISKMRKRVKVVMFIVAFSFVGGFLLSELWQLLRTGGLGSRSPWQKGIIGYIGERPITVNEFRNVYDYFLYRILRERKAKDISEEERIKLEDQVWQYLVQEKNWEEVLKKSGITVTGQEIFEIMKGNPPPELLERPELKDSAGNFDYQKYLTLLQSRENQEYFTLYARELFEMIPKEKFRIDVQSSFRVTSAAAEERASRENKRIKVSYITITHQKFSTEEKLNERELRRYYERHKKDFEAKPLAQLRCLVFPIQIPSSDSNEAKSNIEEAEKQLRGGEDFSLTVMDFSDNPQDTFPLWLKFSSIDSSLAKQLKKIPQDSFSPVFQRGDTYQIVKVEKIEKDSIRVRRIICRIKLSPSTLAALFDSMATFIEKANTEGFDTVIKQYGYFAIPLPPLTKGKGLSWPRLASPSQLEWFAFNSKPGTCSQPIKGLGDEYYIFVLDKVENLKYRPFDQVKHIIEFKVKSEKNQKRMVEYAQRVYERVKTTRSLKTVAQEEGLEYKTEEFNSFQVCRQTKGSEFAGAAYALEPGELSPPIITDWAVFIILGEGKEEQNVFNPEMYRENQVRSFTERLFYELTRTPEIKDFRATPRASR